MNRFFLIALLALLISTFARAQEASSTTTYDLYISDTTVNYTGKVRHAMAINGQIPGPVLHFREGDTAVIRVHNTMMHESSVHWHGLLLPNEMDGVPYLTTPYIKPHSTFTYKFPLRQSGTYWYHSHTMLQEQSGLYGSIVIHPRDKKPLADEEVVLLFSDWSNEKPHEILKTLRRNDGGSEWYSIKKGYPQSLDKLIQHKAWGERVKGGLERMPPMDLSDVLYDRFLLNGQPKVDLSHLKPGSTVRLRVINGSSSTYMYLQYAGGKMELVSADGIDVQPVQIDRILIGIAETYDFVIRVPMHGRYELRATAQDVSGYASAYIGHGDTIAAPTIPRPNVWKMSEMMMGMAVNMPGQMDHGNMKGMEGMDHSGHGMKMDMDMPMDHSKHMMGKDTMKMDMDMPMNHSKHSLKKDTGMVVFNYNMLRALAPTTFDSSKPVRKMTLRLTGNMYRYVWSINNVPLSKADKIAIKRGEVVEVTLKNETMMNHPMHLHGHFFRVLNEQGDYSPLKHTVDVPPMTSITIVFDAVEDKDWFFHCHVLYHMMSGMGRIFHYEGSTRDTVLQAFPLKKLLKEEKEWFFYGSVAAKSHIAELQANYINLNNAFRVEADANYSGQYEIEGSYERYINGWLRPYVGFSATRQEYFNVFNNRKLFEQDFSLPVVGLRYTLPFFVEADLRVNLKGRVRLQLEGEQWLLPRLFLNWRANTDWEYHTDLLYMLSKRFSLSAGYDSRYKFGGGLVMRF
ncbi:multicopper oxidase domain-containing protein [Chitinophaga pendula]|uniref:multicopper oxidase domain-containing protein n=1 Tax=Chitinophaga TaxID=79328 RepID=UPI000BAE9D2C|nr:MULTISPECIES: multicopper oxidase domain-containing protein [Chitinophaga]ASZ12740.1 copper oxidase [Chitinophaga sp. MD30]UCJ09640.1 multicopper oxidase domain-containing protein [Chitinophaga pendula]